MKRFRLLVYVMSPLQVLLYGAALFVGLNAVGVDLTGLAFLSGAIGVGLGFGLLHGFGFAGALSGFLKPKKLLELKTLVRSFKQNCESELSLLF